MAGLDRAVGHRLVDLEGRREHARAVGLDHDLAVGHQLHVVGELLHEGLVEERALRNGSRHTPLGLRRGRRNDEARDRERGQH
ncbi:MAG: hypothetical protein M5U07_08510 [Xanthobacteraceae bacterium]|nr:hypothetical protein [Xanthobacteraceae bacterium]